MLRSTCCRLIVCTTTHLLFTTLSGANSRMCVCERARAPTRCAPLIKSKQRWLTASHLSIHPASQPARDGRVACFLMRWSTQLANSMYLAAAVIGTNKAADLRVSGTCFVFCLSACFSWLNFRWHARPVDIRVDSRAAGAMRNFTLKHTKMFVHQNNHKRECRQLRKLDLFNECVRFS